MQNFHNLLLRSRIIQNKYIAAFIILIISFLLYLPSLKHDFVWDDVIIIKKSYFQLERFSIFDSIFPEKREKKALDTTGLRFILLLPMTIKYGRKNLLVFI